MKRIIFFTLMLGLLGTGCGGNQSESSGSMDRGDEPGYRNGTIPPDTALRDTVDSVLPPTTPSTTP